MCWIWLFLAIFLEVAATVLMKLANGLTRSVPTLGMFVLYGLSFIPMTIALKEMEIGAVYAIWSAVGTAAVAVLGVIVFHEQASGLKAVAIVLTNHRGSCLLESLRAPSVAEHDLDAGTTAERFALGYQQQIVQSNRPACSHRRGATR
jgi:small multidrug resistance pump